jgi:GMP synthase-like glutamine amidotransferase
MRRVLFIENERHVGPGFFASVLAEQGVEVEIVRPWRGEALPEGAAGWDGLAIGGGGMSANDTAEFPYLEQELRLIRAAHEAGTPVFGMCLGAQLIAKAFGGQVYANRAREIGFHEVRLTPAGVQDAVWGALPASFAPAHWHGETFDLPTGAVLLASSALTPHQLFRVGETIYGCQFHLEFDLPTLRTMIAEDADGLSSYGIDAAAFRQECESAIPGLEPLARSVFARWAGV